MAEQEKGFIYIRLIRSVINTTFFLSGMNFEKIRNRNEEINKETEDKGLKSY